MLELIILVDGVTGVQVKARVQRILRRLVLLKLLHLKRVSACSVEPFIQKTTMDRIKQVSATSAGHVLPKVSMDLMKQVNACTAGTCYERLPWTI